MFIRDGTPRRSERYRAGCHPGRKGHILLRQNAGHNALVAVSARHLIADGDFFSLLGNIHADDLVDTGRQLVAVFTGEDLDIDDDAGFAVRDLQRGITDLAGLFAEDGAQQTLLLRSVPFRPSGSDLADKIVAGCDFCADADDAVLVEILECVLADIRDIAVISSTSLCRGIPSHTLNMNGGEDVLADEVQQNGRSSEAVEAFPRHEADKHQRLPSAISPCEQAGRRR